MAKPVGIVDCDTNVDAAWYYANPKPAAARSKDQLASLRRVRAER
jgi:uncharacterized protein (DUF427 family)